MNGSTAKGFQLLFEFCHDTKTDSSGIECLSKADAERWLTENSVQIHYFQSKIRIDYSKKTDYFQTTIDWFTSDSLVQGKIAFSVLNLRLYETTMEDSIINPFTAFTDERQYVQF